MHSITWQKWDMKLRRLQHLQLTITVNTAPIYNIFCDEIQWSISCHFHSAAQMHYTYRMHFRSDWSCVSQTRRSVWHVYTHVYSDEPNNDFHCTLSTTSKPGPHDETTSVMQHLLKCQVSSAVNTPSLYAVAGSSSVFAASGSSSLYIFSA